MVLTASTSPDGGPVIVTVGGAFTGEELGAKVEGGGLYDATIRCGPTPTRAVDVVGRVATPPDSVADPSATAGDMEVSVKVTVPTGVIVAEVTLAVKVRFAGLFGGVTRVDKSTVFVMDAVMVAVVVALVLDE